MAYRLTARRKAALRKAQLVSARKRRGRRRAVAAGGVLAAMGGLAYARHVVSGSYVSAGIGRRMGPGPKRNGKSSFKKENYEGRTRYVATIYGRRRMYGFAYHHISLKNRNPAFRTTMLRAKKLYNLEDKLIKTDAKYFKRAVKQDIRNLNRKR